MRPLYKIAVEIRRDWQRPYYGAVPYLEAMHHLVGLDDHLGLDSASSIVAYFLSNAATWRGETARRVKAELNTMLALSYGDPSPRKSLRVLDNE